MAITVEAVEKLNIAQVLQALEQERKAEAALTTQSALLGASKRELVKVIKQQEAASRKQAQAIEVSAAAADVATDSAGRMAAGMSSLRSQIIDVGVQLQGGQNPLTILSQQGPQAAEALLLIGPAAAAGVAAMSPLLVTLPILAGGYLAYSERAEEAAEAQKKATTEAEEAQKVYKDLYAALTEASIEQSVLSGAMTETEAAQTRAAIAIGDRFGPALERAGEKMRNLRAEMEQYEYDVGDGTDATEEERAKLEQLRKETAKAEDDYDRLAVAVRDLTDAEQGNIETTDRQRKGRDKLTDTLEKQKKLAELRLRLLLDEADAEIRRQKAEDEAAASFSDRVDRIEDLVAAEKGLSAYEAQEERIELVRLANIAQATADTADEKKKIARDLQEALANIGQQEVLQARKDEAQKVKDARDAADKILAENMRKADAVSALAGSTSDLFTAIMESNQAAADAGSKSAQEAMLRQFEAARAAGIIEAGINTAVAITKASTVAPPPFNVAAMVAAGAAGAAQITTIASQQPPTFTDTPGPVRMGAAMGTAANFAQGDTVVAARTPDDMLKQVLAAVRERPGPAPSVPSSRRRLLGPALARDPIARSLTSDLWRVTRGALPPR